MFNIEIPFFNFNYYIAQGNKFGVNNDNDRKDTNNNKHNQQSRENNL